MRLRLEEKASTRNSGGNGPMMHYLRFLLDCQKPGELWKVLKSRSKMSETDRWLAVEISVTVLNDRPEFVERSIVSSITVFLNLYEFERRRDL